jgi:EpsI family protein
MPIDIANKSLASGFGLSASFDRLRYDRWLVCVAFVVFFFPSLRLLAIRWTETGSYGHGFLVVPLALFFLHKAAMPVRKPIVEVSVFHCLLAALSLAWAFAYMSNVQVAQDGLLPALLLAAFAGLYGWGGLRAALLPVVLFLLAIPVWDYAVLPLQLSTARVVEVLLVAADFPVFVDGDLVHVSNGTFEIAGGCSGIRFLLVATILTIAYGQLYVRSRHSRIKLVLAGMGLALCVNWIRVALVVVVGDVIGMQHPLVTDHAWVGWVLFSVALVPLFMYARRLERVDALTAHDDGSDANNGAQTRSPALSVIVVIVVMGVGPLWALAASIAGDENPTVTLPSATGPWIGPEPNTSSWQPRFVGANAEATAVYRSSAGDVYVYANVYVKQTQTAELIGNENSVVGDWRTVEKAQSSAFGGDNGFIAAVTARARAGRSWLIWYWYDIGGHETSSDVVAKLYQGALGLVGERRAGIIALATECESDCDEAATRLNNFASTVRPVLADFLMLSDVEEK